MFGTFTATKDRTLKSKVRIDGKTYVYHMKLGELAKNYEKYKADMARNEQKLVQLKNADRSTIKDYHKKLEEAQVGYGTAVQYLFHVVFGDDITEKLLAFYEGDYETMLVRTIPYIKNKIAKNVARFLKKQRKLLAKQNAGA